MPDVLVVVRKVGPKSGRRQLKVLRPQSNDNLPECATSTRSPLHVHRNNERKLATATLLVSRPGLIEAGP